MNRFVLFLAALLAAAQPLVAQTQSAFDLDKVMAGIHHPYDDLNILYSHRGTWVDAPENSLAAMDASANQNIEVVELDVLLSENLTPWMFHDWTMERQSSGAGTFSQQTDIYLSKLFFRDRRGNIDRNSPIPPFLTAMRHWADYCRSKSSGGINRGYVLVIDLKVPDAAADHHQNAYEALLRSWFLLKALEAHDDEIGRPFPYTRYVIFKLKASSLPDRAALARDFPEGGKRLNLLPILYGDASDTKETEAYFNYREDERYAGVNFTTWETWMRVPQQPVAYEYLRFFKDHDFSTPGFPAWDDTPDGIVNKGICCSYAKTNPADPTVPMNYSGSWEFWTQRGVGANFIGGDQSETLNTYRSWLGKDDLGEIQ
jgi:glycerophosphoryl diester phosphodiesterase